MISIYNLFELSDETKKKLRIGISAVGAGLLTKKLSDDKDASDAMHKQMPLLPASKYILKKIGKKDEADKLDYAPGNLWDTGRKIYNKITGND